MAVATGRVRRKVREYRFEVRLVEEGALWSDQAVRTFKANKVEVGFRGTGAGFARYREEMERNGFELEGVRVVRRGEQE